MNLEERNVETSETCLRKRSDVCWYRSHGYKWKMCWKSLKLNTTNFTKYKNFMRHKLSHNWVESVRNCMILKLKKKRQTTCSGQVFLSAQMFLGSYFSARMTLPVWTRSHSASHRQPVRFPASHPGLGFLCGPELGPVSPARRPGRGIDQAGLFHHRDSSIVLPPQEEQKASAHESSRGTFTWFTGPRSPLGVRSGRQRCRAPA